MTFQIADPRARERIGGHSSAQHERLNFPLAKVGVEGSNPFARSNFSNDASGLVGTPSRYVEVSIAGHHLVITQVVFLLMLKLVGCAPLGEGRQGFFLGPVLRLHCTYFCGSDSMGELDKKSNSDSVASIWHSLGYGLARWTGHEVEAVLQAAGAFFGFRRF
jgi:hypothetical protein